MTSACSYIRDIEAGTEWRGPARQLTLGRILAFSAGILGENGWPQHNLHTDEKKAKDAGLPGVIASGTQFEGYVLDVLLDIFGESWLERGELSVRIPKSVLAGDVLTPIVTFSRRVTEAAGTFLLLDVRVENQNGEVVLVGTARYYQRND